jgi:hypothetical protein
MIGLLCLAQPVIAAPAASPAPAAWKAESVDVAPVWAAHPVGFALLTEGDQQFVAFYDAERRMTLAQRTLGTTRWKFKVLPSTVGWDSHNYVTMALDSDNCLHVSGNMHVKPLVYFRATKPLDIDSVVPVPAMTGKNELHVTYPRFFKGPHGELLFSYRDGSSGRGNNLLDIYDAKTRTWQPLLNVPLMDGLGKMNAYMNGPAPGPDGYYHVSWVWRDRPDASKCHDLSYMRSRDLLHWETADGTPLTLPVTIADTQTVVDPIPVSGGILNGMGQVGFDEDGRVVLSYAKYDAGGKTQLYFARFENGAWRRYQATHWTRRIEFKGGGSLPSTGVHVGPVAWSDGRLTIPVTQIDYGGGISIIDPSTMTLAGKLPPDPQELAFHRFGKVESAFPGMRVNWAGDLGESGSGISYRLRWETLPPNRDQPRPPPWPPAGMLRVVSVATGR